MTPRPSWSPRKAIEYRTVLDDIGLSEPVSHKAQHQCIGHKVTALHKFLDLKSTDPAKQDNGVRGYASHPFFPSLVFSHDLA